MKTVAALFLMFTMTGLAWSQEKDKDRKEKAKPASRVEKKTYHFKEADKEMEYALFVPSTYDKARKTPLVVALHGLYATPQIQMGYPKLTDEAEKYGFIVVAPMGYNTSGWYGAKGLGKGKTKPANLAELSEKDVMNVLQITRENFNIDPERIYLMGHSMGGGGTMHIGMKYPDIWAALAPISPALFGSSTDDLKKIKHIPVLMIQGDKDSLVRVDGPRRWAKAMKELGMSIDYVEVPGGGHIDVAFQNMPRVFEFFSKQTRKAKQ